MKRTLLTAAVALGCMTAAASAQNLLGNASFEDPVTYDGPPFVGSWEGFSGGAGSGAGNAGDSPRTGALHLNMNIVATDNTFAGAFQDVVGLVAGSPVEFAAWYRTPSSPLDVGFESRIEWRNSGTNTEISRTPNFTTAPGSAYTQYSIPSTVPVGADSARVVFAVQTFGGDGPTNSGIIYVDDASFVVVPEPASMALLLGAGAAMLRRRK